MEIILTQTNPNILSTHYLQHKERKWPYLKCKSFYQNLTTTNFLLPTKLQPAKQCRGNGVDHGIAGDKQDENQQHNEHHQCPRIVW